MKSQLEKVRSAAQTLANAPSEQKNLMLLDLAANLYEQKERIIAANKKDLALLSKTAGTKATPAFRDRLLITEERVKQMQESLRQVALLPDPVGEEAESRRLANGLKVKRVRSPLGVVFMIFESRPNVAIEAFSLAFKAGNAIILRGGKESRHTAAAIYELIWDSLEANRLPRECLLGISNPDRAIVSTLLKQKKYIDVVVPRGGEGLIEFVSENSSIPVIKNDRGLCHVFVDRAANLGMAENIVINAKTSRPGVCNAMETLLVHKDVAERFLPALAPRLAEKNVTIFGCPETRRILKPAFSKIGRAALLKAATKTSFDTEYLDFIMSCRVVDSLDEALAHIREHGSRHSEAIVTEDQASARRFQNEVDAAAVYWNASTRFTDGFELGLGGELGISTQKLHARGPVGLRELTSLRWIIDGKGQTR